MPTPAPSATAPSVTARPTATRIPTRASSPTAPQPLPEHRIGVRVVGGAGEFYDRLSGDGEINRALAPAERREPCQPGAGMARNPALNASGVRDRRRGRAAGALTAAAAPGATDS
jgi:hypothetical protein